jgi:hypothetical protein
MDRAAQVRDVIAALAPIRLARHSGFRCAMAAWPTPTEDPMRGLLLTVGLLALLTGLLWIGQGTGTINWPQSSFMIRQIQWAGYGAALAALGLILIWQSKR